MVLTYPKIIRHPYNLLKLDRDVNGEVLVKARLHWAPTRKWWKIVLPICNTRDVH